MSSSESLEKYKHILKFLIPALAYCITLFSTSLQAKVEEEKLDSRDTQFSGPLAVIPEMVSVGDGGNFPDPLTGLGAVQEAFEIGKYPVTVLQWSVFLNAVHVEEGNNLDPRHLFHPGMVQLIGEENSGALLTASNQSIYLNAVSAILKSGINKTYDMDVLEKKVTLFFPKGWGTTEGHYYASLPMTGISVDDAKRYLNWLHHGCPFFEELTNDTLATTETGAYDFTQGKNGELTKGARYFLPSLNQWYKACYYQAFKPNPGYWRYPTQGDKLPPQTSSVTFKDASRVKTGANYATVASVSHVGHLYWDDWYNYLRGLNVADDGTFFPMSNWDLGVPFSFTTPVGLFKDSPGPYGTYDMGGNVREWTGDFFTTQISQKESTGDDSSAESTGGEYKIIKYKYDYVAPGGSYNETSDQLLSKNAKKAFDASGSPTIGLRVAAVANVSQQGLEDIPNNPIVNQGDQKLIQQTMNVVFSQACAYGLEMALNYYFRNRRTMSETTSETISETTSETISETTSETMCETMSKLIASFTLQRNVTNLLVMGLTICLTTGEAPHMNIRPEHFYWDVAYIFTATALTVVFSEVAAGLVMEPFIGAVFKWLEGCGYLAAVQHTSEGWTWSRLIVNIYYIVSNAYFTTRADLDDFNRLQKQSAN